MSNEWKLNEEGKIVFPVPKTVKTPWYKSSGEIPTTL